MNECLSYYAVQMFCVFLVPQLPKLSFSQPAFQKALCAGGNLADLTAKNQAQHMVIDMFALAVSAGCMYAVRNSERGRILLPLFAFPLLAAADLWAIYNELKSVELKMLNRERSEMIAERWLATGRAPSAGEVRLGPTFSAQMFTQYYVSGH